MIVNDYHHYRNACRGISRGCACQSFVWLSDAHDLLPMTSCQRVILGIISLLPKTSLYHLNALPLRIVYVGFTGFCRYVELMFFVFCLLLLRLAGATYTGSHYCRRWIECLYRHQHAQAACSVQDAVSRVTALGAVVTAQAEAGNVAGAHETLSEALDHARGNAGIRNRALARSAKAIAAILFAIASVQ